MKIKVTDSPLDYDNKPIKDANNVPSTWRTVFFTALNSFGPQEQPTPEEKEKSYRLTKMVFDTEEPDLSVAERAYLIERIEKVYVTPLICGRAKELLEEKPPKN